MEAPLVLQSLMALQQGCIADGERLVIAADVVEVVLAVSEGFFRATGCWRSLWERRTSSMERGVAEKRLT